MSKFKGFTDSETFTQLPDTLFHQLLKQIDSAEELKVTLYFLSRVEHMDSPFRAMRDVDFDPKDLGLSIDEVRAGLEKAVIRGSILQSQHEAEVLYFLNSPRGRAAAEAFADGRLREPISTNAAPFERLNIFRLYEENIGPLTPLIADTLKDAEETYYNNWIAEAITIAVRNNKRNWKYCEAILKRWKEEGKKYEENRGDSERDRRRYIDGEFSDFIEH